mmetsp:Transcript_12050/g.12117  ORF Transcript_12050/g.12117 Transcript_12050/m.12117 type:complete len:81 (+) Transcript_12050:39-281(+)
MYNKQNFKAQKWVEMITNIKFQMYNNTFLHASESFDLRLDRMLSDIPEAVLAIVDSNRACRLRVNVNSFWRAERNIGCET